MNLDRLKAQIKSDEGKRLTVYADSLGRMTVGIGHKVTPLDVLHEGDVIDDARCEQLFAADLATAIRQCTEAPNIPFIGKPDIVQEALVNLCFNLGLASLSKFVNTLAMIREDEYAAAGAHLLQNTGYVNQVGDRARRIAAQIASAETPEAGSAA